MVLGKQPDEIRELWNNYLKRARAIYEKDKKEPTPAQYVAGRDAKDSKDGKDAKDAKDAKDSKQPDGKRSGLGLGLTPQNGAASSGSSSGLDLTRVNSKDVKASSPGPAPAGLGVAVSPGTSVSPLAAAAAPSAPLPMAALAGLPGATGISPTGPGSGSLAGAPAGAPIGILPLGAARLASLDGSSMVPAGGVDEDVMSAQERWEIDAATKLSMGQDPGPPPEGTMSVGPGGRRIQMMGKPSPAQLAALQRQGQPTRVVRVTNPDGGPMELNELVVRSIVQQLQLQPGENVRIISGNKAADLQTGDPQWEEEEDD